MIEISHVSFKYANAKEPALHDISLSIQKGEFVSWQKSLEEEH